MTTIILNSNEKLALAYGMPQYIEINLFNLSNDSASIQLYIVKDNCRRMKNPKFHI